MAKFCSVRAVFLVKLFYIKKKGCPVKSFTKLVKYHDEHVLLIYSIIKETSFAYTIYNVHLVDVFLFVLSRGVSLEF